MAPKTIIFIGYIKYFRGGLWGPMVHSSLRLTRNHPLLASAEVGRPALAAARVAGHSRASAAPSADGRTGGNLKLHGKRTIWSLF